MVNKKTILNQFILAVFGSKKNTKTLSNSTITIIAAIIAFGIDYYFKGTIDNSIGIIIFCIAVFLVVYFKLYLTVDQEDLSYKQEYYNVKYAENLNQKPKTMEEKKPKPSSWASTDPKPVMQEEAKQKVAPPKNDLSKIKEVVATEAPEATEAPKREGIQKVNDLSDANVSKGIRTYSLHNVHKKYRAMFDDMHSFAIKGGDKPEQLLIDHFRKYGFPLDIKRPEGEPKGLIAFNLGFLRMPLEGFFGVL